MDRRRFLAAASVAPLAAAPAPAKPNIVVILVDDMGFSDIGSYGGEISTPNLDALARGGVRFTQFCNTARCCPTRSSLLTGLYPHQTGVGHMVDNPKPFPGYRGDLNRNCRTIAEVLKPAGYQTMMAGKWHVTPLTGSQHNWPLQRGFDKYYGTIHGAGNFFNPVTLVRGNAPADREPGYYYTDATAAASVSYLEEAAAAKAPFFLYTAFTAPHWPMHAPPEDIERYRGRYSTGWDVLREERHRRQIELGIVDRRWPLAGRDPQAPRWRDAPHKDWQQRRMEVYAAMVDRMDQGVGRIMEALRRTGQEQNTLVLFLSDNGGCAEELGRKAGGPHIPKVTRDGRPVRIGNDPSVMPGAEDTFQSYGLPWAMASNTPFRSYKHWVHEGGIATPLIAWWPGHTRPGLITHQPGHVIDIMATCVDVSGAAYSAPVPMEGVSLRAAFTGRRLNRRDALYFEHEGNRAVREGRWKLVSRFGEEWELYDLETGRTETDNLARRHPDRAARLAARYETWARRANVEPWDKVLAAPRAPSPAPSA
ncbi:MAG: arylsulfatase [Bryobacteraceae bacterium]|nr:arylsulfatase [Bryobacteraceae bacterium]